MINKQEIIKAIENDKAVIRYDDKWRWFKNGDDQKTCPLLDFMFQVEYRSGTLIFIPDKVNKCKMVDRNKE